MHTITSSLAIRCPHCGDVPVTEVKQLRDLASASMLAGIQCPDCFEEARVLLGGLVVGGTRGAFDTVRETAKMELRDLEAGR